MKRPTGVAGVGWIWDSAAEELGRSGSYCGFRCVAAINVMRPAAAWAAEADPARLQRIADATFWPHVAGGFHMSRDTLPAIERAGFTIERSERFGFTPGAPVPSVPHILGVAHRSWSEASS